MNTYLALFLIATFASLGLTPIVRRVCQRCGWLDNPEDGRRVHSSAIPRLGGVAIFSSVVIALSLLFFLDNLVTASLRTVEVRWLILLLPTGLIFLVGVYDDLKGASAPFKFVAQGLAATLFFVLGGRIDHLSVLSLGSVELPLAISFIITVVWIIGISNAFNLIDGMDGLAAGAALFASLVLMTVSLMLGHPQVTAVTVVLCGALIGFLRYNFNPASIFLGDSGSLTIGFLLAALSVQGAQKASTVVAVAIPLLAFSVPVFDTGFAIARRFISGKPLFEGDREHVHHKLLDRGWSQRRVVLVLYGVCALFGLLALLFVSDGSGRSIGFVLAVVAVSVVFGVGRLRYHEVDEVKAGFKRNLGERRVRVANNIHVRRASRAMSDATTLSDLFAAVQQMLEHGEFVYASVQLGRGGDAVTCERILASASPELRGVDLRGGMICWSWERGDIEAQEVIESHRFWTLRLPLSTNNAGWGYLTLYRGFDNEQLLLDINYLYDLFQGEMARAVERVFEVKESEQSTQSYAITN